MIWAASPFQLQYQPIYFPLIKTQDSNLYTIMNYNNQNQYQYQTRSNNQFSNTVLQNIQNNQQISSALFQKTLETLKTNQNTMEMQYIFYILDQQLSTVNNKLDQFQKQQPSITFDQNFNREVKQRCIKIKKQNENIAMMLFNFKENMQQIDNQSFEKNISQFESYNLCHNRIKKLKLEIISKLHKLKSKSKSREAGKREEKKINKMPIMNVAFTQLKDAVVRVNEELIKQREQIMLLMKQLYNKEI